MRHIRSPRAPSNLDTYKVEQGKHVFAEGSCAGCHSGDKWTISTRFYEPSQDTMKALATKSWFAPEGFPPELLPATADNAFMRFPAANGALDQIQCILRPVGTFAGDDGHAGAAELRADMKTVGQGNETDGKGFNPPSLLGLSTGAPYLHNGGALTLESLLGAQIKSHPAALAPGFLDANDPDRAQKIEWLAQYLLSIDEDKETLAVPAAGALGGDFCAAP